uniref:Uncharacterized protein n=1 Tax=Bursaphelenchus xylophilus TaxID=6326 RepID=A0A1I7RQ93_BURXY
MRSQFVQFSFLGHGLLLIHLLFSFYGQFWVLDDHLLPFLSSLSHFLSIFYLEFTQEFTVECGTKFFAQEDGQLIGDILKDLIRLGFSENFSEQKAKKMLLYGRKVDGIRGINGQLGRDEFEHTYSLNKRLFFMQKIYYGLPGRLNLPL